jgi:hypothetical protein
MFAVFLSAARICEIVAMERLIILIYGGSNAQNTGDRLSGLHKGFREKRCSSRLLQAVANMKWHQRNAWKMAEYCNSSMFLSLTSCQPSLSYSRQC